MSYTWKHHMGSVLVSISKRRNLWSRTTTELSVSGVARTKKSSKSCRHSLRIWCRSQKHRLLNQCLMRITLIAKFAMKIMKITFSIYIRVGLTRKDKHAKRIITKSLMNSSMRWMKSRDGLLDGSPHQDHHKKNSNLKISLNISKEPWLLCLLLVLNNNT